MHTTHMRTPGGKLRARGAGVPFTGVPGANNSITDVRGIEVGYCTLIRGDGALVVGRGPVRTGVTAIFPRGRGDACAPVHAGYFSMSGNGEMSGAAIIEEQGVFAGPITLTNTHSCGLARDVTAKWLAQQQAQCGARQQEYWLPVAAETFDGILNDIDGHHVHEEHVRAAFDAARAGAIEEGSVGGGTGMRCYQFKGGSGTASRRVSCGGEEFHVAAFVQANFGKRRLLHIAGIPVGLHIPIDQAAEREDGSIIGVVATDAPLLPHQLRRLARRAAFGIARSGGIAANESGDLFVAFSTANRPPLLCSSAVVSVDMLVEEQLSALYEACIEATDEAILNSLFANETMVGRDGNTIAALPIDEVRQLLRRHGRLASVEGCD